MAKPVKPGTGTTHSKSKALQPEKQNRTRFADSIRASSPYRLHQQAGQKTAPDPYARSSNRTCNAGAIHRGHSLLQRVVAARDPKRAREVKRRLVEPTGKPVAEALHPSERGEAANSRPHDTAMWRRERERGNYTPRDGGDGTRCRLEHFQTQPPPELQRPVRMYCETCSSHRIGWAGSSTARRTVG